MFSNTLPRRGSNGGCKPVYSGSPIRLNISSATPTVPTVLMRQGSRGSWTDITHVTHPMCVLWHRLSEVTIKSMGHSKRWTNDGTSGEAHDVGDQGSGGTSGARCGGLNRNGRRRQSRRSKQSGHRGATRARDQTGQGKKTAGPGSSHAYRVLEQIMPCTEHAAHGR